MKKASTAKRKTASRSKQAGAQSRAPRQRKPRGRATSTAAAKRQPKTRAKAQPVAPQRLYSQDERASVLLLLVPFAVMAIALGAIQALGPLDAVRRQLALLPNPLPLVQALRVETELAPVAPATLALASVSPAAVSTLPVRETAGTVGAGASVMALPPGESLSVRLAGIDRADRCVAEAATARPAQTPLPVADDASRFGERLARAARAQTRDLVVYTDDYRQIGFPMGDVPRFYGVCTDVVVRAYRALGVDLQVLVHQARIGTGDPSIDHRRTKTLKRFFERYGETFPVTDFVEDYQPGDIVTYYRAGGRTSQTHIAIVSDVIAPSGRPMIVHNRGWGPQLEDALFSSDITGHYRFTHAAPAEQASAHPASRASAMR